MKGIVLGAGVAGLGAAYANKNLEVYEKNDYIGGLCSNFIINGFRFDRAVHFSFSNDDNFKELINFYDLFKHKAYSLCHCENWFKHPIQNNLNALKLFDRFKVIFELIFKQTQKTSNFDEWLKNTYGKYLYDNFFSIYNSKYWRYDLSKMSLEWLGNRFYKPSILELIKGAIFKNTKDVYYAKEMCYPMEGGYINIFSNIINEISSNNRIHLNSNIFEIDIKNKLIKFNNNNIIHYDYVLSSIPLSEFNKLISNIPDEIFADINSLEYTSVALVSFGLKKITFEQLWFYIYDKDIKAARAYMPSAKSCKNVPDYDKYSSIQFEIYYNSKYENVDKNECINNCIYALKKMGICNESDIIFSDFRTERYANIIYTIDTEEKIKEINQWLINNDIYGMGRFGEWKYLWSDQSFMSGYKAAQKINFNDAI